MGGNGSEPEDSDADISTGQTTLTTLTAGEVDLTWDAGIIIPTGIYNLGNFVWFDINNNGIYDLGEVGVNNVTVELYNDYNNDGMPQPNEFITTSVTVTKSGVNGIYNFNNLPEGNYIVLIPESSLQGPLSGYTNSTGNGVAPDPDDNIENDDNGTPLAGYGVVSKPITIGSIAEPLEGGYTNHSVDFGFFPSPVCTMGVLLLGVGRIKQQHDVEIAVADVSEHNRREWERSDVAFGFVDACWKLTDRNAHIRRPRHARQAAS